MQKKLTITIDEKVYDGLYKKIGRRKISNFIENIVRPHVIEEELAAGYKEMANDELREKQALEWSEALAGDVKDEPR
jgi:predicted CopG family antitoxin